MASVNKVIVVGNLGRDPETRYMPNGDCVCHINVATSEKLTDKVSGEKKEITEWHRVVMFRKLGEIASLYLKKGMQVYLEGRLQTRKWVDKEGRDRYTTEIVADHMHMLGSRPHDSEHDEHGVNDGSDDAAAYADGSAQRTTETPLSNGHAGEPKKNVRLYPDEIPF